MKKGLIIGMLVVGICIVHDGIQVIGMEPKRPTGSLKRADKPKGRNISFGNAHLKDAATGAIETQAMKEGRPSTSRLYEIMEKERKQRWIGTPEGKAERAETARQVEELKKSLNSQTDLEIEKEDERAREQDEKHMKKTVADSLEKYAGW